MCSSGVPIACSFWLVNITSPMLLTVLAAVSFNGSNSDSITYSAARTHGIIGLHRKAWLSSLRYGAIYMCATACTVKPVPYAIRHCIFRLEPESRGARSPVPKPADALFRNEFQDSWQLRIFAEALYMSVGQERSVLCPATHQTKTSSYDRS